MVVRMDMILVRIAMIIEPMHESKDRKFIQLMRNETEPKKMCLPLESVQYSPQAFMTVSKCSLCPQMCYHDFFSSVFDPPTVYEEQHE